jgi:hypothetical protein
LTLAEEWRSGNRREARAGVCEFEQGFKVRLAGLRDANDVQVHDLFARETDTRYEPCDSGMEPEEGTKGFFAKMVRPIAAADVEQFVTGNGGLELRVQGQEAFRQENDGRGEAESDGRVHGGGKTELGTSANVGAHFLETG